MNILKKYLKDHHITMQTFAYILGVSSTSISHWVSRRATPRPRTALKIEKNTKKEVPIEFWGYVRDKKGKLYSISTYSRKSKKAPKKPKKIATAHLNNKKLPLR